MLFPMPPLMGRSSFNAFLINSLISMIVSFYKSKREGLSLLEVITGLLNNFIIR